MTVDGIYGANTANAVIKYQRANGLSVDGIVGDETRNSIYRKKKGEGILFSYFRHNDEEGFLNVESDTRIAVLNPESTDKFLWGAIIKTPSSSGDFCTEQYDKGLKYKITPEQGKKILESGIILRAIILNII